RQAEFRTPPFRYCTRASYHYCSYRDLERAVSRLSMELVIHQIVNRSSPGQDRSGRKHRSLANYCSLVHAAVSPDKHVIFNNHRKLTDRFEHAPNLRRSREVNALPDLRAGTNQGVRIYHRSVINVGADIDEHRRHAGNATSNVTAITNR